MNVHSNIIPTNQKVRTTQMSISGRRDKHRTWSSHMMEYYSAVKRNKVLILVTTWMNLKTFCQVKEVRHKRPIA